MYPIETPFKIYTDLRGNPLNNGYVYIGVANANPVTSPITVYWDTAGTKPALQPLRTENGYIMHAGTPANVYTDLAYSELVRDSRGRQVFYQRNSQDFSVISALISFIATLLTFAGSSLVGFLATTNYLANTIGAAVQDGRVNVMWFLTQAERLDVKAYAYSFDLTPKIDVAKAWAGNRPLYMPAGGWGFTTLDFKENTGGIIGDGINVTILKCRSAVARALDFNDVTDINPRAGVLKGFTLEGDGVALGIGIDQRYRHQFWMEDLYVRGFTGAGGVGIKQLDTYTCHERNVRTAGNGTGRWIVGSNHASTHTGGGSDSNTVSNLLIETNGTPADGNESLVFTGFVVQSAGPVATGIDITCSSATFNGCYMGENNETREAITMRAGRIEFNGGVLFTGFSATSYGITPLGGKATFNNVNINGQTFGSIEKLIGGATNGKVAFYDVDGSLIVSGNPVLDGDPLDYGPQGTVYCTRLGKNFTTYVVAATSSTALVGNNGRITTCLTVPGPNPFVGMSAPLINNDEWRDGEPLSLIVVYSSNVSIEARVSGAVGAGAPSSPIGTLPATGGLIKTSVILDFVAASTAWTLLEIYKFSGAIGDTFTVYECFLSDSRTLNKNTAQFGSLYKN
jgi:Head binding.